MRRKVAFGVVLTSAVLSVGLMGAAPAAAKGPPEIVTFDEQFQDVNPCTGAVVTVFASLTLRVHEFNNEAGNRHHFNVQFMVDVETSDGFSGRLVGPDIDNGEGVFGEEEGTGIFASMANGVISNRETGQRFRVHVNAHFVQVNGEPVVDNATFVFDCLGPNGA